MKSIFGFIFVLHFFQNLKTISATAAPPPSPVTSAAGNGTNNSVVLVDEIIRRVVREASNETVESYSPADFIFNSCDLENLITPVEILRNFPYYLSGFDQAERPIWIAEFGKFDLKKITTGSQAMQNAFEEWTKDVPYNFIKSLFMKPSPGRPNFEIMIVIDFEGLKMSQLTEKNVRLLTKMTRQFSRLIEEYAQSVVILNVNQAAKKLGKAVGPFVSQDILDKVEIFGENKDEWLPYMRRTFPLNSIPEWYGGNTTVDFKPVEVYG